MNRLNLLLGVYIALSALILVPCTANAITSSVSIEPGYFAYIQLMAKSGSYSSTGSVVAFISDWSGVQYYQSYGSVPSSALWSHTGTSGSFSGVNIAGGTYYLVFANEGSSTVTVTYTINVIPGFELVYTLIAVLALGTLIIIWRTKIMAKKTL